MVLSFGLRTALALTLAASVHLCSVSDARADSNGRDIVHVVAKGQTLGRIAKRYRVSVEAIRDANDLPRGGKIKPGLKLVIPVAGSHGGAAGAEAKGIAAASKQGAAKGSKRAAARAEPDKRQRAGARGDDDAARWERRPPRPGFIKLVRGSEKLEVQLLGRKGRLMPTALEGLGRILRHIQTNAKTPIDPRLAALLGMVSDHFGGRTIHVVSGFRPYSPKQHTKSSKHNFGRAVDFSVEGVPNTVVRDYCRSFRNAGVGYYPNSTFVHLDVRNMKTYWIDYSRPGEPPRYDPAHRPDEADEAAGDVHDSLSLSGSASGPSTIQTGSPTTQERTLDSPDSTDGIRDTLDFNRRKPSGRGASEPSLSPAPGVP